MGLLFSGKQSSHQTQRNNKKLTSSGFKQQPICTPLAPTENKSSIKQLAPTDPILGPENLLKTGFAQKGLPSDGSSNVGRHRLGSEHVQNSSPETWSHPNTIRASRCASFGWNVLQRRPDGSVGIALVLPALTDCR